MLKLLRQITQEVTQTSSLQEALDTVVFRIKEAFGSDVAAIFLSDLESGDLLLMASEGLKKNLNGELRIPRSKGLVGLAVERRIPINIENAPEHERHFKYAGSGEETLHGLLAVPIQYRKRVLGVVLVEQEQVRRFDDSEEAFLVTLAAQLANIILDVERKGHKLASIDGFSEDSMNTLKGVSGSNGVSMGNIVVVYSGADLDAIVDEPCEDVETEREHFLEAIELTREEMRVLMNRMSGKIPKEEQSLFDAYITILDSESLKNSVFDKVDSGLSAKTAFKYTVKDYIAQFKKIEHDYMRERVSDIEDLARRVLENFQYDEEKDALHYFEQTVLVGQNITAAQLVAVPEGQLLGVVSGTGSINSHVAILARALGVPAVMGVGDQVWSSLHGLSAIVDGYLGQVYLSPAAHVINEFKTLAKEEQQLNEELEPLRNLPAETIDDHRVALYVNMGLAADISRSMMTGAEGIGLYRTEVLFMLRDHFPSSEEQRIIYRQMLNVFSPKPVVMRLLDIGGDKVLPYFNVQEDNPFLGWRGLRVLLEHPEIMITQVQAMMRASEGLNNLKIMLPMVTDLSEVEESIRLIKSVFNELKSESLDIQMPEIGIMIEVPSAVYQASSLAQRVDFLSVGSNDLIQYLLAVDRNNTHVALLYDSLHPAVLKALTHVVEAGQREGKRVSICGEMAADPIATILLLGMGFDMLSLSAPMLPRIKKVIREFSMSHARKILNQALNMQSAGEIRRHVEFVLEEKGLGGLIRAGRH